MSISNECGTGCCDAGPGERGMGDESESAMHSRELLSVCVSICAGDGAVGSCSNVLHISIINGML